MSFSTLSSLLNCHLSSVTAYSSLSHCMCHLRERLIITDILKTIETLRDFQSAPILRRCPLSIDRKKYTDYRNEEEHFCERSVVIHWNCCLNFTVKKARDDSGQFTEQFLLFFSSSYSIVLSLHLENLLRSSNDQDRKQMRETILQSPQKSESKANEGKKNASFFDHSFRIHRVINRCTVCL